jgi:hypothetical protein
LQICIRTAERLLERMNLKPKDIGIVIVNCSLFSPTPSLVATILNHFKMPSTTIGYNLSGMGCSGGCMGAGGRVCELLSSMGCSGAVVAPRAHWAVDSGGRDVRMQSRPRAWAALPLPECEQVCPSLFRHCGTWLHCSWRDRNRPGERAAAEPPQQARSGDQHREHHPGG